MAANLEKLHYLIKKEERIAIYFSGGIDSLFLATVAIDILDKSKVHLIIGDSLLHHPLETKEAIRLAESLKCKNHVIEIDELSCSFIRENHPDSWYYSKLLLYQKGKDFTENFNISAYFDGMNCDDLTDYRPGLKARDVCSIRSPLVEAGFDKQSIRFFAKQYHIEDWNKVPSCSLLSRFAYHQKITKEAIEKIITIEDDLKKAGFSNPRARYYHSMVKIELQSDQIDDFIKDYRFWNQHICSIGFNSVAVDIGGYQYGNLNYDLSNKI